MEYAPCQNLCLLDLVMALVLALISTILLYALLWNEDEDDVTATLIEPVTTP